jgi:hypothetical protein
VVCFSANTMVQCERFKLKKIKEITIRLDYNK